jgi:ketosteroid isomerase-like protein
MLDRVHAAISTMVRGDPEPYMGLWSHSDDVSLFGAWGPCKQGWSELSQTFRWVASRFGAASESECVETVVRVNGDAAYTVGYERGDMVMDGECHPTTIRVTHVYQREAGDWKLVHRHGDFAPLDQSTGRL